MATDPIGRQVALASKRSRLIGVVVDVSNPFHTELIEDVHESAQRHGYNLVLSAVTRTQDETRAIETLLDSRCAALVLLGSKLPDRAGWQRWHGNCPSWSSVGRCHRPESMSCGPTTTTASTRPSPTSPALATADHLPRRRSGRGADPAPPGLPEGHAPTPPGRPHPRPPRRRHGGRRRPGRTDLLQLDIHLGNGCSDLQRPMRHGAHRRAGAIRGGDPAARCRSSATTTARSPGSATSTSPPSARTVPNSPSTPLPPLIERLDDTRPNNAALWSPHI